VSARVVLLGGGYVTLHAYAALARRMRGDLRRGRLEVVVVSADAAHSFHGFTGEVASGQLPFERTRTPLTEVCPRAWVIHARVTGVDTAGRTVTYRLPSGAERTLSYTHLVVGTGGAEPTAQVPGLAEHGCTLRGTGDIKALVQRVRAALDAPDDGLGSRSVVVAGGGMAGVELAAALADLGRDRLSVTLVHRGPTLLPALRAEHPRLAERADAELERLGVRVRLGTGLASVTPGGARLSDGSLLAARTVLGTVGQQAVQIPGLCRGLRDERGRLVTAPDLSVAPGVWAAGDAARVLHAVTGHPVPANALWAIKGGAHVGANIARVLDDRQPRPFRYRGLGQVASFGLGRSVGEIYGVELTGVPAWLVRLAFFLRFMPSRRNAAAVVSDLTRLVAQGGARPVPADTGVRASSRLAA
jgi:NADH:ubiquinone reductase (H+-translocating)